VIQDYKPRKILEIGTLYGYSAILMSNILPEEKGDLPTLQEKT